ncbi:MAG TPA: Fe-S protein assembly co-chaperone HscB [Segetibacter sp.]|jgi:molecular chaperone HscB
MNYFDLYNIPVSLKPNQQEIKKKFYELSRKYHPDFASQGTEDEQAEALEKSSLVNKAYKTFNNPDDTIKYVLQSMELLEEEEKYQLPPEFLMEVIELNEQLVEAKMEQETSGLANIKSQINNLQSEIYEPVKNIIENYKEGTTTTEELLQVKEYYFKKKYLNRILEGMA